MDIKNIAQRLMAKYKYRKNGTVSGDNDNIRYKEIVKEKLLECTDLAYAINSPDLKDAPMDAYYGTHIKPFLAVPETQHELRTYIMYDTSFDDKPLHNDVMKYGELCFIISCPVEDIIDEYTGIARHDLIAAILQDEINWSHAFGTQMRLISDKSALSDGSYATRTLIFQQTFPNGIVKTKNKSTRMVNHNADL